MHYRWVTLSMRAVFQMRVITRLSTLRSSTSSSRRQSRYRRLSWLHGSRSSTTAKREGRHSRAQGWRHSSQQAELSNTTRRTVTTSACVPVSEFSRLREIVGQNCGAPCCRSDDVVVSPRMMAGQPLVSSLVRCLGSIVCKHLAAMRSFTKSKK